MNYTTMNDEELKVERARIMHEINTRDAAVKRVELMKYVGKCFKCQNNYSCPEKPEDYWQLFTKVLGLSNEDWNLKLLKIQTDKDGKVDVAVDEFGGTTSLVNEITHEEFNWEYDKMLQHLRDLN